MNHAARAAALILAGMTAACASGPPPSTGLAAADPHATVIDGQLWIYPTGGKGGLSLSAWSTADRTHWVKRGELIHQDRIGWIDDDGAPRHHLWAPAVITAGGHWYLYYSVGPQNPTPSRIGVAVADRPEGPFIDSGRPLLTGGNGFEAIDPMVYRDPRDGTHYLYAGGSDGSTLRVFVLKPDMVTIAREVAVDQPPNFTEGAFMHERNGTYYLSYSHGKWNGPSYSVHYATAPSPTGPWRYRGVILEGDARRQGPGHHSFVRDPASGDWLIVYHRWERPPGPGPYKGARRIAVERIAYGSDGAILPVRMTDVSP
ncbi:glycosyl hydrolase 43 family protein [Sphingomonas gilva]|uniref:Glycosyl hydrolase 43 family protein n=1 Tax=Sphingomonas gilva TaxID=2305907 RepID=A0A396RTJ6_9SPHN|nr:family 43 glycosylhydrolase [Sphingomonas gilva]RHW18712.1 glycosyl hydrolase 43 family protein [Sphingomonas gilva]